MTTATQATFPDKVLDASEKILLRDLFESPTFSAWLVSAISNGLSTAELTGAPADDDDQYLQFRLHQMLRAIPYETRRECFAVTGKLIRARKERRDDY
jgi:hypothetical protein